MPIDPAVRLPETDTLEGALAMLTSTLEVARMGFWSWNQDTDVLSFSASGLELLGFEADHSPQLNAEDPDDVPVIEVVERLRSRIPGALGGDLLEVELQMHFTEDSPRFLLARGRIITDSKSDSLVVAGVLIDVSEQRQIADARSRLAERQVRAGEQAVRMQRITSKLASASNAALIRSILLNEGGALAGATHGMICLLDESSKTISRAEYLNVDDDQFDWKNVSLDRHMPLVDCIREARPVLFDSRAAMLREYPDRADVSKKLGIEGFACFPLAINGRAVGSWLMYWDEEKTFDEGDLIIYLTLASQCAQALERLRLFERERFIATALQRTILPAQLPKLDGALSASRYIPSASGVEVGGDWYDILPLPGNRVALVIGDVGGHNIDAAAVMGQLRNAIRSYAWEGHPAAKVLEATNRLLCGLDPGVLATCCYVDLGLEDGIAQVALAGHPPPLVVDTDGSAAFMNVTVDPPLGTDADHTYEQSSLFMTPGQTVVLYTDGVIETRRLAVDDGMAALLTCAEEAHTNDAESLADAIIDCVNRMQAEDDVALLLLQYAPEKILPHSSKRRTVRRNLPSSPASAGVARRFATDLMEDWGADDVSDTVALCVSELVTNALIHTATDIELVLILEPQYVQVEIVDQSDRMPSKRRGDEESTTGRGLHIVEAISSEWGVRAEGSGKAVWFRVEREPALV